MHGRTNNAVHDPDNAVPNRMSRKVRVMEVCITVGGVKHCFVIPVLVPPVHWGKPGPGPINYPQLFQDATIIASMREMVQNVGHPDVSRALQGGLAAGLAAMQQHAGDHVAISAGSLAGTAMEAAH